MIFNLVRINFKKNSFIYFFILFLPVPADPVIDIVGKDFLNGVVKELVKAVDAAIVLIICSTLNKNK